MIEGRDGIVEALPHSRRWLDNAIRRRGPGAAAKADPAISRLYSEEEAVGHPLGTGPDEKVLQGGAYL